MNYDISFLHCSVVKMEISYHPHKVTYTTDIPSKPNGYEDRQHEHSGLFVEDNFAKFDPSENIEAREGLFNNHTQQYVKDSKIKY